MDNVMLPDPEALAKDVGDAADELADSRRGDAKMRAAWVRNLQALARCLRDGRIDEQWDGSVLLYRALVVPLDRWEEPPDEVPLVVAAAADLKVQPGGLTIPQRAVVPNADPNDVLRQTPPEVFGYLEALVSKLEEGLYDSEAEAAEAGHRAQILRKAIRSLRERDVMAQVLNREENGLAQPPGLLVDPPIGPLAGGHMAQRVRQEVEKQAHLWTLPRTPLPGRD